MSIDQRLSDRIYEMAIDGYKGPGTSHSRNQEKYQWLRKAGTHLWLDTGDASAAAKAWGAELEALTTNNTLVNQVVQTGVMDDIIRQVAAEMKSIAPDMSEADKIMEVGFLVNAKLALSLIERFGVHVSVELHPSTAYDVDRILYYARRYYAINPDYFYVKVPITPDGFIAVRKLSEEKIPVNYTLGFSARQNYLAARFSHPAYVNVFLGRLNSLVEDNGLGSPENVGEKVTLASCEAMKDLRRECSQVPTQQIAASMRNGKQVAILAGVDVHTIPPKAALEYLSMDIAESDIRPMYSSDLSVDIASDGPFGLGDFEKLWEIDDKFVGFVDDAVANADNLKSGADLVALSRKHGAGLFADWAESEHLAIREGGKIPDLSKWQGKPLDDLMSVAALESFVKDQSNLDKRIAGLIG